MRAQWLCWLALLVVGTPLATHAQQPLTLAEALARADRLAYPNRMAEAARLAQDGEGKTALRGILPTARIEAGWMRTTDPLNAFGFTLRQRAVTAAAFDPARLNDPAATSHVNSALVLEQPLVNLDAWAGRRAAASATKAATAAEQWAVTSTRVDVVRAWFGGVLAAEKVATLEAAHAAALGHVRQAEALLEQGMVTRADLLLAQVKAGELEADLVEARGGRGLAVHQLALILGTPDDPALSLPAALPDATSIEAALVQLADHPQPGSPRNDVRAAQLGSEAAATDLRRARAALLPRLNGFARYDWNSPDAVFGGTKSWTLGVMASWALFSGGAELSGVQAARGRAEMAAAGADAATAKASLEVVERDNALAVARARLAIADRAVAQSEEAHRLVGRSYAGGLATITELLGAAAAKAGSRLAHSAAIYRVLVSVAERQQARGLPLDILVALGR